MPARGPTPMRTSRRGSPAERRASPTTATPRAEAILDEVTAAPSSYYIDHSEAPAPPLISNGWTDDLFPPDEALRFYNRTRSEYPGTPVCSTSSTTGTCAARTRRPTSPSCAARENEPGSTTTSRATARGRASGVEALTKTCPGSGLGRPVLAPRPGPRSRPARCDSRLERPADDRDRASRATPTSPTLSTRSPAGRLRDGLGHRPDRSRAPTGSRRTAPAPSRCWARRR